jgi:hypothetical protein
MAPVAMFLFALFLVVFVTHVMAFIMSFFMGKPNGMGKPKEEYVNPYRLVPRKEAESYKRYERQMYNDSLRNKKRKN